jgi:hypothetical protein
MVTEGAIATGEEKEAASTARKDFDGNRMRDSEGVRYCETCVAEAKGGKVGEKKKLDDTGPAMTLACAGRDGGTMDSQGL